MRCTVQATDAELVARGDVLVAHIRDLQEAAEQRLGAEALAKSRLTIKAHPHLALNQMRRTWLAGYQAQMQAMLAELTTYLHDLPAEPDQDGAPGPEPA